MTTGDQLLDAFITAAQEGTPTPHQRAADIFLAPYLARIQELEDALAVANERAVRLILRALAECVADPEATVIVVVQDPIVNWTDRYVNKLAHQLGVDRSRVAVMTKARATRKKLDRQWGSFPKRMIELHDFD